MFKTRLMSSIALVIIMVAAIFAGPLVFALVFGAISLIGMMELYRIYGFHKSELGIMGYICAILFDVAVYFNYDLAAQIISVLAIMVILALYVFEFPKYDSKQIMAAYFGFIYVAVMLSYVFRIRAMQDGILLIWLVFICSWINDTCAYAVGILIGKHKMTPKLSPKKSYEGAVGGIAGTAIVAAIYGYVFRNSFTIISNPPVTFAIACSCGAFISIIGDLAASAIKRNSGVKDYGRLIPGHGGILDRFDSMIMVAPIIYWFILLLG
jgi:phosphatidate cytidylyltransferase